VTNRRCGFRAPLFLSAVMGLSLVLLGGCWSTEPHRSSDEPKSSNANVLTDAGGGVKNVTFYYQGSTSLERGQDLSELGRPAVVVTTPKADERSAIAAIHSTGAKAYRYVQFYWAPDDSAYEGINLAKHPSWAFCRRGDKPLLGRVTGAGPSEAHWYFIDANERSVRSAFSRVLEKMKGEGWDGVMFDRGGAALTNARDAAGRDVWDAASSCTGQPYEQRARFADAYVNMLGLARQHGLGVLLNYGTSPFDPLVPMRPDPADPACRDREWDECRFRSDVWSNVDLVLNEAVAFPKDQSWQRTFEANQRSEHDAKHGQRVVGLITTYTLGGKRNQTRAKVFYEWSRVKLFNLALAVNTGDGGCPAGGTRSGVCNRYGTYPELANIRFGAPVDAGPRRSGCSAGSSTHCVWTRAYTNGLNVLNASPAGRSNVEVDVPGGACRYVYDVYEHRPLAGNKCVSIIHLDLPAWSGRPLLFSKSAFG
jgi:hypothetical protein